MDRLDSNNILSAGDSGKTEMVGSGCIDSSKIISTSKASERKESHGFGTDQHSPSALLYVL